MEKHESDSAAMNPEYLEIIKNFRLMDDDFMRKCFENAPECIELILRIVLGKKDLKVVKSQTEYPIESLQGRGVRFDVYARDSKGREYDIEIQRSDAGAGAKRARYNSAMMDANALEEGDDTAKLHDTYVIFITENDVMKGDQDLYEFDRTEKKSGKMLGDGTHIVYVNGATRSKTAIGKLMQDFRCKESSKMHFKELKKKVHQYKDTEEGRQTMCKAMEEFGERRERKGRAEGRAEGAFDAIVKAVKAGAMSIKRAIEVFNLDAAQVKALKAMA